MNKILANPLAGAKKVDINKLSAEADDEDDMVMVPVDGDVEG